MEFVHPGILEGTDMTQFTCTRNDQIMDVMANVDPCLTLRRPKAIHSRGAKRPGLSCARHARSNRAMHAHPSLDLGLQHHTWTTHPCLARIARSINPIVYNARNLHTAPNAVTPTAPHSDPPFLRGSDDMVMPSCTPCYTKGACLCVGCHRRPTCLCNDNP
jgi:hypothetical protein